MPALMLSVGDDVAVEYRVPGDGAADGIVPFVTRAVLPCRDNGLRSCGHFASNAGVNNHVERRHKR